MLFASKEICRKPPIGADENQYREMMVPHPNNHKFSKEKLFSWCKTALIVGVLGLVLSIANDCLGDRGLQFSSYYANNGQFTYATQFIGIAQKGFDEERKFAGAITPNRIIIGTATTGNENADEGAEALRWWAGAAIPIHVEPTIIIVPQQ